MRFDDLDDNLSPPQFEFPSEQEQEDLDAEFEFMRSFEDEEEIGENIDIHDQVLDEDFESGDQEYVDNENEEPLEDEQEYYDAVPITIIEDLNPLISLCEHGDRDEDGMFDSDDDLEYPPGFGPDDVHVNDWIDSDDELHPEGQNEININEREPEFRPVLSHVEGSERVLPDWFPPMPKVRSTDLQIKRYFKMPRRELVGKIISWKYDHDNKVIVVKRRDGLQYFPRSFKLLSSLPKCEINCIGQKWMINHSGDGMMNWFSGVVRNEVDLDKFCYLHATYPKRRVDWFDIEPISNQPRVITTYKKVKCLKEIPLEKLPINFSHYIHFWRYNGITGEAEIGCYDRKDNGDIIWRNQTIIYVYDPLSLINLSLEDLTALSQLNIRFLDEFDDREQALKFQRVVEVCVRNCIHAGGNLPE